MSFSMQMPVVILAGGMGTRLKEETEYRPKPLVKIGHQPILWHIMKIYAHHGFKNFIVCLGYKGELIRQYFSDYGHNTGDLLVDLHDKSIRPLSANDDVVDWKIVLADTGRDSMTGGRIRRIRDYVGSEEFLVTYGDGVADVDIPSLVETHRRGGTIATVTGVQPSSRYGELMVDGGLVTHFREKQAVDQWINGGFFVFNRKVFDYLEGDSTILEHGPLERLVQERQLGIFRHRGFWQCMDTYREVDLLNRAWDSGEAPWKVWK